eukprot:TRINITY_DN39130_c0_g1_i1.p1 TRINITY_DN39130_c0_g1~~TRINITY_DN39130_c0_g1_i1.p1  ORF type:complete len:362 (+),score=72.31 TRINITY_DN39130_c0_g1_i1:127-1086(+)
MHGCLLDYLLLLGALLELEHSVRVGRVRCFLGFLAVSLIINLNWTGQVCPIEADPAFMHFDFCGMQLTPARIMFYPLSLYSVQAMVRDLYVAADQNDFFTKNDFFLGAVLSLMNAVPSFTLAPGLLLFGTYGPGPDSGCDFFIPATQVSLGGKVGSMLLNACLGGAATALSRYLTGPGRTYVGALLNFAAAGASAFALLLAYNRFFSTCYPIWPFATLRAHVALASQYWLFEVVVYHLAALGAVVFVWYKILTHSVRLIPVDFHAAGKKPVISLLLYNLGLVFTAPSWTDRMALTALGLSAGSMLWQSFLQLNWYAITP